MSCRLLRHEAPAALPLFDCAPGVVPAFREAQAQAEHEPAMPSAEEVRLRSRVRELEAALATQIEAVRQLAREEGEAAGYERAATATRPVLDKLAASVAEISDARARIRRDAEADLIALSLAIARRILRREISVDPDAIQGLVRAAFDKLQAREVTRVRVAPGQEDAVQRSLAAVHAGAVEITVDASLRPGDVVVETARGNLDASIDTQLSEIERGFADRLR